MLSVEWFIALRYLRGKRKIGFISLITWISAAGVFLGSLVLVVALSIANGFEKEVRDRIVGTLAHARLFKYHGDSISNPDSLRRIVLKMPGVTGASPYIMGKGAVEHENIQEGVMITGIDGELEPTVTDLHKTIKFGTFSLDSAMSNKSRSLPGVLIGINLADKMGVRQNSEVVLMSLVQEEGATDPSPRLVRCVVKGVFETGMYEYDMNLIYVSMESARFLFNSTGAEGLSLKTRELFAAPQITKDVQNALGGYPYTSIDWQAQNKSLFQWMKLEKLIIFIVISLIMVVAAFNIVSSLIMMILEKRREIGILMSMGLDRGGILKVFLFNGAIVGIIGSTAGTAIGLAFCFAQMQWHFIPLPGDLYFINRLPILLEPLDVALIYLAANLICIIAAAYPAWQASRILPAESIRYE